MFLLYHGSVSHEVQLVHERNPAFWALLRKKALNYLTLLGAHESAKLLSELPFEHWEGTNGSGEQFDLLYLHLSIRKYLELKLDVESHENRQRFRTIADPMQEGGNATSLSPSICSTMRPML
jgi:hypothetical protein